MDDHEYDRICSLAAYPAPDTSSPLCASVTEEQFAVIQRQLRHRHLRAELRRHGQDQKVAHYIARRDAGESICAIALSVAFSPCMLARVLLKAKYQWSKATISRLFKEAMREEEEEAEEEERGEEEEEGTDGDLRATTGSFVSKADYAQVIPELRECVEADAYCSPLADRVRHSVGQEYEDVLLMTLRTRQLVFESEATLRAKGLSKTPDVRLLLPIGVKDAADGERLHVVHWIDSKAMFGDRYTHDTENASQLQGYVNRFGPGMVIYWFGHVAHLSADRDVFVTDAFPQEIALPGAFDPLAAVPKVRAGDVVALRPAEVATAFDEDYVPITSVVCE
ncbi:unnamed protein product [Hyaloperonospora brassicae]|uniref:CDAN1-interacting nuclease 1 n=1 Tax=Hyaloperonospora brassicae TaxID=162125 RepID=A0AAV0UDV6_HYABA|nr:unnamed protein product [Hyaloperonospora brassicae]